MFCDLYLIISNELKMHILYIFYLKTIKENTFFNYLCFGQKLKGHFLQMPQMCDIYIYFFKICRINIEISFLELTEAIYVCSLLAMIFLV